MMGHQRIDERSLAFGRAIAARIADHPELVDQARRNVNRWLETCSPGVRPALHEWLAALNGPIEAVMALLTANDERATRLRQSNPFAGLLPEVERNRILREFQLS
jgi:hypothetical protein